MTSAAATAPENGAITHGEIRAGAGAIGGDVVSTAAASGSCSEPASGSALASVGGLVAPETSFASSSIVGGARLALVVSEAPPASSSESSTIPAVPLLVDPRSYQIRRPLIAKHAPAPQTRHFRRAMRRPAPVSRRLRAAGTRHLPICSIAAAKAPIFPRRRRAPRSGKRAPTAGNSATLHRSGSPQRPRRLRQEGSRAQP